VDHNEPTNRRNLVSMPNDQRIGTLVAYIFRLVTCRVALFRSQPRIESLHIPIIDENIVAEFLQRDHDHIGDCVIESAESRVCKKNRNLHPSTLTNCHRSANALAIAQPTE
jgi:hypothetical protein